MNKCTFIIPNFPWTSHMKNELQYEYSTGKLFCSGATIKFPRLHKFPDLSWLWAFSPTIAEFPEISRFPEIPENGNSEKHGEILFFSVCTHLAMNVWRAVVSTAANDSISSSVIETIVLSAFQIHNVWLKSHSTTNSFTHSKCIQLKQHPNCNTFH